MDALQNAMSRLERRFHQRQLSREELHSPRRHLRSVSPVATLFGGDAHATRHYHSGMFLDLPGGGKVSYRGQQLLRDDRAVWAQLREFWLNAPESAQSLDFSPRTFLKAMGWGTSTRDQARLRDCLERMQATVLRFTARGVGNNKAAIVPAATQLSRSMITCCEWRPSRGGQSGRWHVWIDEDVRALFAETSVGCDQAVNLYGG